MDNKSDLFNEDEIESIGNYIFAKIKQERIRQGYSVLNLSWIANISNSYVSYVENGRKPNVGWTVIYKITKALDMDLGALFQEAIEEYQKHQEKDN